MISYCEDQNIALTPYSPLASGRLTRGWDGNSLRSSTDSVAKEKYDSTKELDLPIVKRLGEIAKKYQVTQAQVALSLLISKPQVTAPIIGGTKPSHLEGLVNAPNINLSKQDLKDLEEFYHPHEIASALKPNDRNFIR